MTLHAILKDVPNTPFDQIQLGQSAEYTRKINEQDIEKFAAVSGDYNPIHMDETYAKDSIFKKRIAHGLLSASFISSVLSNQLPGPGSIYLDQELHFKVPVRIGDEIRAKVEVIAKDDRTKRITLSTTCRNQRNTIVLEGKAVVILP